MRNVFRVLKRDALRLLKTPAAMVVVAALLVLPSVYTWYNVLGFWNPYENTGGLKVSVVNEDVGASSELTGELDVGGMIVEKLREDHRLGWSFSDRDTAMESLMSGDSYAVFVIPEGFTERLLSLATGDFEQPDIEYYVNEKTAPVAPKITDTGATTLDETVNATFVATVSDVVVTAIDEAVANAEGSIRQGTSAAIGKADEALAKVSDARESISAVKRAADGAKTKVSSAKGALGSVESKMDDMAEALPRLQEAADDASGKMAGFSDAAMEAYQAVLEALAGLEPLMPAEDYEKLKREAEKISAILGDSIMPASGGALFELQSAAGSLEGALSGQRVVAGELEAVLDELDGVLDAASGSLGKTAGLLDGAYSDIDGIRSDLLSLSESNAIMEMFGVEDLDADRIAGFMGAPTEVATEQLYHLDAYGSAMAPLFMNLTFWIGAFMLLVIMRQEVDGEGIGALTLAQRYLARFLLFAVFAVLQAVICVAGVLFIGVEPASPPALFFASAVASLAYLSIIYSLSVTLQHIGKGICLVLVFAQIPAATGLYPVEMTSSFFQAVYPLLPFTYGIGAMRESIFGFYGMHYAEDLAALALFFAVFLLLGILLRPLMGNVNRMVASQVRQSGIYNGEDVEIPARPYRASQLVRMLSDQEEFRSKAMTRYEAFEKWRPRLIRGTIVLGVLVPVALVLVFALTPAEKVAMLTLWLLWMVVEFVFLVVLETLRFSFRRQMQLGGMTGETALGIYSKRNHMERSGREACEEGAVEAAKRERDERDGRAKEDAALGCGDDGAHEEGGGSDE